MPTLLPDELPWKRKKKSEKLIKTHPKTWWKYNSVFHMGVHILIIYIVLKKYVYLYVSVRGMCTSVRCPQKAVASDPLELQTRCTELRPSESSICSELLSSLQCMLCMHSIIEHCHKIEHSRNWVIIFNRTSLQFCYYLPLA